MKKLLAGFALAALLAFGAVTALGATKTVKWRFPTSSTVKIARGSKVKWVWTDAGPHSVQGPGFHSAESSKVGFTYTHTFRKKGRFTIICGVHGDSMKTVVKVG